MKRPGAMMLAVVFMAICVTSAVGTNDWCSSSARTPTVCSEERQERLSASETARVEPRLSVDHLSLQRALKWLDATILGQQNAGTPAWGLHLLRGRVLGSHGLISEALCEFQLLASVGMEEAATDASTTLRRVQAAEQENFTALDGLRRGYSVARTSPNSQGTLLRLMKEWRLEHVHHSTAIEGNRLSYEAVRAFLETRLVTGAQHIDPYLELLGVDDALDFLERSSGFGNASAFDSEGGVSVSQATPPLSEQLLLEIHRRVLPASRIAGVWRRVAVRVADHVAPPPEDVPRLMAMLFAHWRSPEFAALHPVEQAALAHFEFAWVHPFKDGNGRTARLLSSYLLMRAGFPPLNILHGQSSEYFSALKRSHPRNGGCTRQLVQLMYERVRAVAEALLASLPCVQPATEQSSVRTPKAAGNSDNTVDVGVDGVTHTVQAR